MFGSYINFPGLHGICWSAHVQTHIAFKEKSSCSLLKLFNGCCGWCCDFLAREDSCWNLQWKWKSQVSRCLPYNSRLWSQTPKRFLTAKVLNSMRGSWNWEPFTEPRSIKLSFTATSVSDSSTQQGGWNAVNAVKNGKMIHTKSLLHLQLFVLFIPFFFK